MQKISDFVNTVPGNFLTNAAPAGCCSGRILKIEIWYFTTVSINISIYAMNICKMNMNEYLKCALSASGRI